MTPVRFERPTTEMLTYIQAQAIALPVLDANGLPVEDIAEDEADAKRVTLAGAMTILDAWLAANYARSKSNEADAPRGFDYEVTDEEWGGMRVLVRLFSLDPASRSGNVYYGSTLVRIGEDDYLEWVISD